MYKYIKFMNFLINEKQFNLILEDSGRDRLIDNLKTLNQFAKDILSNTSTTFLLNTKIFLTWGTSIAGFLYPVDNFIKTNYIDISDSNRNLILVGVFLMLFFNTKESTKKIVEEIYKLGFKTEFNQILKKSKHLKTSFKSFLRGLNITTDQTVELIAYCFLIPIIGDINNIIMDSSNYENDIELIVKRIVASGMVLIGYNTGKKLFQKLFKLFG